MTEMQGAVGLAQLKKLDFIVKNQRKNHDKIWETIKYIPNIKKDFDPDIIIVNGENSAGGFGITAEICNQFFESGVDVITANTYASTPISMRKYGYEDIILECNQKEGYIYISKNAEHTRARRNSYFLLKKVRKQRGKLKKSANRFTAIARDLRRILRRDSIGWKALALSFISSTLMWGLRALGREI